MISLKHENGPGSNAGDGELHNFGWLDDFYEKEKTVECEFNIFLWKPVLFWPQTILYLHPLSRWYVLRTRMTQRWFPLTLECNILVLSIPCWNVTSLYYPPSPVRCFLAQAISESGRETTMGGLVKCLTLPPSTKAPNYLSIQLKMLVLQTYNTRVAYKSWRL